VRQLLENPEQWHGARFADPLEPDYREDNRIAWANLCGGGRPYLYSHAHGGQRYVLIRQKVRLRLVAGSASEHADRALEVLREDGRLYERQGGGLCRVPEDRHTYEVTPNQS
jgi:hypothetical protein